MAFEMEEKLPKDFAQFVKEFVGDRLFTLEQLKCMMAYSAEESSPVAVITESCCVCNEEFSSDSELTSHLIDHANDEEFRTGLLELEKKSPVKKVNSSNDSTPRTSFSRAVTPLKRTASQRSGSPEVWEIISDDSDDEKNKKSAKTSNSFRLE